MLEGANCPARIIASNEHALAGELEDAGAGRLDSSTWCIPALSPSFLINLSSMGKLVKSYNDLT
jgi:hypothetical protein